jgi:hypothetical protein
MPVLGQALVGIGDDAARYAEFGGEHAGGGQPAAHRQAAVGDREPEPAGQPGGQATGRRAGDVQLEEVRSGDYGPVRSVAIGPVHRAIVPPGLGA